MLKDDGVRLPGARREALRRKAEAEGIEVADAVLASLRRELKTKTNKRPAGSSAGPLPSRPDSLGDRPAYLSGEGRS